MILSRIREIANSSGIDLIGIIDASPFENYNIEDSIRKVPNRTIAGARSIIVAAVYIGGMVLPVWDDNSYGRTSRLYLSGYFLDVIEPLKPIARFLKEQGYKAQICDSSSAESSVLTLKIAAVRAGLGWQGKHSLLISKEFGSYLALGGIITDAELEYNKKLEKNRCSSCNECRKACPMNALEIPYLLNRELCLSNILQTDSLPVDAATKAGNRVGDCEICQDACPWNQKHRKAPLQTRLTRQFQEKITEFSENSKLSNLIKLDKYQFEKEWGRYKTEIPFSTFYRNIENALMNMEQERK